MCTGCPKKIDLCLAIRHKGQGCPIFLLALIEEGFRRIQYFSKKILTGNYTRILVKSKHKSLNDLSID